MMKEPLRQLVQYLDDTLGIVVKPIPWPDQRRLPPFLQDRYEFFQGRVLDTPCLFMVTKDDRDEPPAAIRKHIDQMQAKWLGRIIYVRQQIVAYNRKRLIEHKVPFIVPGNQLYLPTLGIDLREHFRTRSEDRPKLRPASQAVLIHMLLHDGDDHGLGELVQQLGYTAMTISRSLDELETAGLAATYPQVRERRVRLARTKAEVWKLAQPLLRTPVQNRRWVRIAKRRPASEVRAGLTALAQYSALAEPENVTIAVSRDEWQTLRERDTLAHAAADEPGALNIEVWTYPPGLFATGGFVDRLSLYLSLREATDERVEAALEQMLESMPW